MIETTKPNTDIELKGSAEELGKEIYWLLCGKKEEKAIPK